MRCSSGCGSDPDGWRALLPIFRSRHQAHLVTVLLLHPDEDQTVSELADRLEVPSTTLRRKAQRLVDVGLLTARVVGPIRVVAREHRAPGVQSVFR